MNNLPRAVLAAGLGLLLGGCAGGGSGPDVFDGLKASEQYAQNGPRRITAGASARTVSVDGVRLDPVTLNTRLAEAAGAVVVEEMTLDHVIAREAERRGVTATPADLEREREWLARAVGSTAAADPDQLVRQVRARRGLGPDRFEALLRRNALLRAMVRDEVQVTAEQVALAHRVQHGERVRVRLLVTPTLAEAQRLRQQVLAAGPRADITFAELARAHSTDGSAPLGGLIEPFSPDDPAYEAAVRRVAADLAPGQVGQVAQVQSGYAVVYMLDRLPPDGVTLAQAQPALRDQIARRQERVLMDELATRLLAAAQVRVLDPALLWSVEAGRGG